VLLPFCVFTHLTFSVSFHPTSVTSKNLSSFGTLVHNILLLLNLSVKAKISNCDGLAAAFFHRLIDDSLLLFFQHLHRWVDCCFALLYHLGFCFSDLALSGSVFIFFGSGILLGNHFFPQVNCLFSSSFIHMFFVSILKVFYQHIIPRAFLEPCCQEPCAKVDCFSF